MMPGGARLYRNGNEFTAANGPRFNRTSQPNLPADLWLLRPETSWNPGWRRQNLARAMESVNLLITTIGSR